MNTRIPLLLTIILPILMGCKRAKPIKQEHVELVGYQGFHNPAHLSFAEDTLKLSSQIFRLTVVDSVLLAADLSGDSNLEIIGLNSKKILRRLIKRGNNRNETINISDFSYTDTKGIVWTYDLTLKKFQEINVARAIQNPAYQPESEFVLKNDIRGITSPSWVKHDLFASLSLSLDDCRYLYLDKSSSIKKKVGQMPAPEADWPEQNENAKMGILGMSYSAILRKHPSGDKVVVLYENTDRIDFYQHDTLKKIISGPEHFKVIKTFHQQGTGAYVPRNIDNTKYAFFDAYVTDKYIYALYGGTTNPTAKQILIFDWEGIPVKRYILDRDLTNFAFQTEAKGFNVFAVNNSKLIHTKISESSNEQN